MTGRPVHTPQDLGAGIRDARLAHGLTQAQLAERAGVSREWLGGVEQGRRSRAELIKVLGVLSALDLDLSLSPKQVNASETVSPASRPPLGAGPSTNDVTRAAMAAARGRAPMSSGASAIDALRSATGLSPALTAALPTFDLAKLLGTTNLLPQVNGPLLAQLRSVALRESPRKDPDASPPQTDEGASSTESSPSSVHEEPSP